MGLVDIIVAIVAILGLAGTIFANVKAYGAMQNKVDNNSAAIAEVKTDISKLEERLASAEEAALHYSKLADAVEHMGIRFADQIKNLVDTMKLKDERFSDQIAALAETTRLKDEHNREQLADIKAYLNRTQMK